VLLRGSGRAGLERRPRRAVRPAAHQGGGRGEGRRPDRAAPPRRTPAEAAHGRCVRRRGRKLGEQKFDAEIEVDQHAPRYARTQRTWVSHNTGAVSRRRALTESCSCEGRRVLEGRPRTREAWVASGGRAGQRVGGERTHWALWGWGRGERG
jgi:hypothetical protein